MTRIEEMRSSMMEAGVYSIEDIEEICRLESEYAQECEEIADQCAEEGYPSHGSNYDLRCENARRYYDDAIDAIDAKYEYCCVNCKRFLEDFKEELSWWDSSLDIDNFSRTVSFLAKEETTENLGKYLSLVARWNDAPTGCSILVFADRIGISMSIYDNYNYCKNLCEIHASIDEQSFDYFCIETSTVLDGQSLYRKLESRYNSGDTVAIIDGYVYVNDLIAYTCM